MKCDELKPIKQGSVELGEYWVYDAEEVDAAIAELKAESKKLKASSEQIMNELFDKVLIYHNEMVSLEDAYKLAVSLKNTKRALWLQRVKTAKTEIRYWRERLFNEPAATRAGIHGQRLIPRNLVRTIREWLSIWDSVERKCRAKAEEYK